MKRTRTSPVTNTAVRDDMRTSSKYTPARYARRRENKGFMIVRISINKITINPKKGIK